MNASLIVTYICVSRIAQGIVQHLNELSLAPFIRMQTRDTPISVGTVSKIRPSRQYTVCSPSMDMNGLISLLHWIISLAVFITNLENLFSNFERFHLNKFPRQRCLCEVEWTKLKHTCLTHGIDLLRKTSRCSKWKGTKHRHIALLHTASDARVRLTLPIYLHTNRSQLRVYSASKFHRNGPSVNRTQPSE